MQQGSPLVEVRDVVKTYKGGNVRALNGISLSINQGEIFGLIGPNGAGKTTLIGCMLGLLHPDTGSVTIGGKPPHFLSVLHSIGYMPERPDFEYWMTARQFLTYHHGLAERDPSTIKQDIEETLELVELSMSARERRLKTYSRGMLQRLNLAQMVIGKPAIMLLDEPTLGLDPTGVAVVRRIVGNMKEAGVTAIINSHQLDEIERMCDRVAFIRQGKIAAIETLKGGELCDYVLFVRWAENSLNGTLESTVQTASSAAGASISEIQQRHGRFVVHDSKSAAKLIRELVTAGVPVDEAVPERMRLEQLFSSEDAEEHIK
ncbi:MAG: ABC transporter ATP-binding protein [Candidatus Obscuribacterales bacterium]|nr:ABC transporter ATP-binding protein [Candidatus Obscuribacterales bacterium]